MARSEHVDRFNHDAQASEYDRKVLDEADPVRTGYSACLDWVARRAMVDGTCAVLELGAGTGNLTQRIPPCRSLVCVDISGEMIREARAKLPGAAHITWVTSDLLEFFEGESEAFDRVVSTYAIHHLMENEKVALFAKVAQALTPAGYAVFGDLMFENERSRIDFLDRCRRADRSRLADAIVEEYFWDVEVATSVLQRLGLEVRRERFSELSWGIVCRKDAPSSVGT